MSCKVFVYTTLVLMILNDLKTCECLTVFDKQCNNADCANFCVKTIGVGLLDAKCKNAMKCLCEFKC
ncbi:hypothetical protein DCAR_0310243 [Daucus carota subsp. sativus]|uniref:Knottin scorpion toxin-like domain-containing protein n=1 Tax=Daucus carota subsp. sativus TaxID=79200 RepID=A0AAF0WJD5_DAUCS|nr:hypothetical protein DCAR_0310243 [Daucus carota subsp. sativus]